MTELNAPGKLAALLAIAAMCFAYIMAAMFTGAPDSAVVPAWATLGTIVGYLVGNGTGARKGEVTQGVWQPKPHDESRIE